MNDTAKQRYKSKLEAAFIDVEKYLKSSKGSAAAVAPDKNIGRLSRMEAMQDQQMVLEMRRRKKRQLAEIKSALMRIETDQYGRCLFCSSYISQERLDVTPEAQTCVSCS
jgi:DnaK suppressor protein